MGNLKKLGLAGIYLLGRHIMGSAAVPLPYPQRPEWADLVIMHEPPEASDPLVPISYSSEYREAMAYFWDVFYRNEMSQRALDLTTHLVQLNDGHYTVWHFRRCILQHLKHNLKKELEWVREFSVDHPKTYQLWHHREWVVDMLDEEGDEFLESTMAFQVDQKNYHAWQFRQWLVRRFDVWSHELGLTDELLRVDVYNNSAWNHRFFANFARKEPATSYPETWWMQELEYVCQRVHSAPDNVSAWLYLEGFTGQAGAVSGDLSYRLQFVRDGLVKNLACPLS